MTKIKNAFAKKSTRYVFALLLAVIVSWGAWWKFTAPVSDQKSNSDPLAAAGQFGDKFGALNTLFTGLAFVGVIAALWHERENADAREAEHKADMAEMREQTDAAYRSTRVTAIIASIEQTEKILGNLHNWSTITGKNSLELRDSMLQRRVDLVEELFSLTHDPRKSTAAKS